MKKLFIAACMAAAVSLQAQADVINVGGTNYTFTRAVDKELVPGVQYLKLTAPKGTYGAQVHLTIVDLTRKDLKVEYHTASGTIGGSTKTLQAIASANNSTNHKVVAGANANFWITSEKPWNTQLRTMPFGSAVSNGTVYTMNATKASNMHVGGTTATGIVAIGKDGRAYIKRYDYQYEVYHARINHVMDLTDMNRVVEAGTASIYTPIYGRTTPFKPVDRSTDGTTWNIAAGTCTEVLMDLEPGQTTTAGEEASYIIKEVRTNAGTGTLGNHDVAMVGRDSYASVMATHYKVGDKIVLRMKLNNPGTTTTAVPAIENATSGNIVTMENGVIRSAEIQAGASYNGNWYARTIYGTNNDGSKLYIIVCSHQHSAQISTGMSTEQLTQIVKHFGATYAAQVDCGGSAQMWTAADGLVGPSSDASGVRAVHSGMFVVQVPATASTPSLASTAANTAFGSVTVGQSAARTFSVTGTNLTGDISLALSGAGAANFAVSPASVAKATAKANFTVTYKPTAQGAHTATLTISTAGASPLTYTLSGTGVKASDPDPTPEFTGEITNLNPVWEFSTTKGNTADAAWWQATGVLTRDIAVIGDKLFALNASTGESSVSIIDANTGKDTGAKVNLTGVSGGTFALASLDVLDGTLYGSNVAAANTGTLKVYRWTAPDQAPQLALEYNNTTAKRIGDKISTWGTAANGRIMFSTPEKLLVFAVTDGNIAPTPTVIALPAGYNGANCEAKVVCDGDNSYWIFSKDKAPARFDSNGQIVETIPAAQLSNTFGSSGALVAYGDHKYMAATAYKCINGTSIADGVMELLDITSGAANATRKFSLPENGLGAARNTNFITSVCSRLSNNNRNVALWVNIPGQGVAMFACNTATATPVLKASATAIDFGPVTIGDSQAKTFTAEGSDLTADITVSIAGTDAAQFAMSPVTIAKDTAKGTVTVTYTPTAEGDHTATVTISSTGAENVTIALSGTGKKAQDPNPEFDGDITALDMVWLYSTAGNNTADAPWWQQSGMMTRSMALCGDNLVILNSSAAGAETRIVNANTGTDTGRELNLTGVSGGTIPLAYIQSLGDRIYGTNVAANGKEFRIYRWNNIDAAPEVALSVTNNESKRIGDKLSVYGNDKNGKIMFLCLDKIIVYTVTDGNINATPQTITLAKSLGGSNCESNVIYNSDGTFWVISKDNAPTLVAADGSIKATVPEAQLTNKYGSAAAAFDFGRRSYLATTAYICANGSAIADGVVDLLDITDGAAAAQRKHSVPQGGFGATRNTSFVTSVAHSITDNGRTLNLWANVPMQGIAMFRYKSEPSAVDSIMPDDNSFPVEYYNLNGIRVSDTNLAPGIYIRRQGRNVTKVLVK